MAFNKNRREPVPEVETEIWACTSENCSGFMRAAYSFDTEPKCPLCQSDMVKETRILPVLD
ncbi:cold-shock protein [Pullulanibacillus sp. KACC 23026]|uniref:cold-shock protein n=1 Tax=Pullulanibacillus sp. KACC 23026 TaxID=3028315 RepID=UPI0023B1B62E|nr:cold-shock protein [Pullulanibacillus sp. KACC 23026]WEG13824.1 cold-shock protein [Pullulanibacillus sp. KACC 23026]